MHPIAETRWAVLIAIDALIDHIANGRQRETLACFTGDPARKLFVVATDGRGFVVPEAELIANTRNGRQVMGVSAPDEMRVVAPAAGDTVSLLGGNRKLLLFPLSQVQEMTRGKGVPAGPASGSPSKSLIVHNVEQCGFFATSANVLMHQ